MSDGSTDSSSASSESATQPRILDPNLADCAKTGVNLVPNSSHDENAPTFFDKILKLSLQTKDMLENIARMRQPRDLALADLKRQVNEMHQNMHRDRRMRHFRHILAKFVVIAFLRPLDFPPNFYCKLRHGGGQNLVLCEQVRSLGATMGVSVEHLLEWEPLIGACLGIFHPQITKADFIAVVKDLIADRQLSGSSVEVFEMIFDIVDADPIRHGTRIVKATDV